MAHPPLTELTRDLGRALKSGDLDQVAAVRRTIIEAHPASAAAAEAAYKLGLDALFRAKNPGEAAEHLRTAAKSKEPHWALPARTSLALIMMRQGKPQQAAFELRKVAATKPPSLLTAQAQAFLVMCLHDQKQGKEANRIRGEMLKVLQGLTKSADPIEAALAHLQLGLEHKFDGERGPAKQHLEAARASGALPAEELALAEKALKEV